MSTYIPENIRKEIISIQKNEITEFYLYNRIAKIEKSEENKKILHQIAQDEMTHYEFWSHFTGEDTQPNKWKIFKFYWIVRILGLTFGTKLMENGEIKAQKKYDEISQYIPEAKKIMEDEDRHERELLNLINEEKLNYAGSIVLGLNDALVELTGALAGLTLALQNTKLIAITGMITGIAASMSMAASAYLSSKTDKDHKTAVRSAVYTGIAYIITVLILVTPYLLFSNFILCLVSTLILAILIIFLFNYYISVAKDLSFRHRFTEMTLLSMAVAGLSFIIGILVRKYIGVDL